VHTHHGISDAAQFAAREVCVIPNGVADPEMGRSRRGPASAPVVLYVGVLRESKGIFDLLDAAAEVQATGESFIVRFVGAFDSEETENRFEKRARALGLWDKLQLTGPLDGPQVVDQYLLADLVVFPTYFESESFGLVLI